MFKTLNQVATLIIEDDEDSLLVTQRLLQLAGTNQIACYRSAAAALAELDSPVDLVLLDIELGDENGAALLPQLRQDKRCSCAIIVALTANVLPQDVTKARLAGFDGLLGKPLNFERFGEQLQQLLDGESVWEMR